MRILHVSSWFQPKLGYSEYHLPRAQQAMGHTVAVVTSDRYYPFPDYEASVGPILGDRLVGHGTRVEHGILTHRLPVYFERGHRLLMRGMGGVIRSFKPDVVHIHEAFTLTPVQVALFRGFFLLVASSMEKEVFHPQSAARRMYYRGFAGVAGPLLRLRVGAFTAVGAGAREILADVMGIDPCRVEVVPLGADAERFAPDAAARGVVRRELGIGEAEVLVVYAGKLIPNKDAHVLVEAASALAARRGGVRLLLIGNGMPGYMDRLKNLAAPAGDAVIFRGAVPNADLPRYFAAADIGVWPSESSNAAIEAALAGIPIVVSDIDATRHYIAGDNGLSFPRGDAAALTGRLEELVNDPGLRAAMGANGRRHVTEKMSWQAIARRYLEIYAAPPR